MNAELIDEELTEEELAHLEAAHETAKSIVAKLENMIERIDRMIEQTKQR